MYDSAILVLLYNKEMHESSTISTLAGAAIQYSNAKLVIWNNGPDRLKNRDCKFLSDLGYDVSIRETVGNESLAIIYNQFIRTNSADKYILLDDDSSLNDDYINASSKSDMCRLSMPIVTVNNKVESPVVNGYPYNPNLKLSYDDEVLTIGSGLVIGGEIVNKLQYLYEEVFDERFFFYGIDTTFCLRVFRCNLNHTISFIKGFNHSLSRLEPESKRVTKFRCLERSYDFGLTYRYYYSLPKGFILLSRLILSTVKNRLLARSCKVYIYHLVKGFIKGKHYRNAR